MAAPLTFPNLLWVTSSLDDKVIYVQHGSEQIRRMFGGGGKFGGQMF